MNGHINNVVYIGWGLESVPGEVYEGYTLYEVSWLEGGYKVVIRWLEGGPLRVCASSSNAFVSASLQMEVDFKAECQAGDTVQSSLLELDPSSDSSSAPPSLEGNGSSTAAKRRYFLHTMQLCDESNQKAKCTELVRARTSWRKE